MEWDRVIACATWAAKIKSQGANVCAAVLRNRLALLIFASCMDMNKFTLFPPTWYHTCATMYISCMWHLVLGVNSGPGPELAKLKALASQATFGTNVAQL